MDEHRCGPSSDDLDTQLVIARKQLEIAKLRRELIETVKDFPMLRVIPPHDTKRSRAMKEVLAKALEKERAKAGIPIPQHVKIEDFVRDWVQDNWLTQLSHVNFEQSKVPHEVIDRALRALYSTDYLVHETLEEVAELEKKGFRSFGPAPFRRLLFAPVIVFLKIAVAMAARPARWLRLSKGYEPCRLWVDRRHAEWSSTWSNFWFTKKASEIRAERRQHWIQKVFSSTGFIFTGCAAAFMSLMLVVGLTSLWNAVCQGLGAPWQWRGFAIWHGTSHIAGAAEQGLADTIPDPHNAMKASLDALEIILVAPLPYLLILGLMRYIKALAYQERADEFRKELLEFKAFEVALFIAIIAAAVVGRILEDSFNFQFAAGVALVIGVLAAYYYIIEKSGHAVAEEADIAEPLSFGSAGVRVSSASPANGQLKESFAPTSTPEMLSEGMRHDA